MRGALVALFVVLALVLPAPANGATDIQTAIRAARGDSLPVLPLLQRVAVERAGEIVQDYSHFGPGAVQSRSVLAGWSWGEIIVWNSYPPDLTVASAIQQWLASPGHRAILLGHWAGFGAAEVDTPSGHYFAAIFGTPPAPVLHRNVVLHPRSKYRVPTKKPVLITPAPYVCPAARWRSWPC